MSKKKHDLATMPVKDINEITSFVVTKMLNEGATSIPAPLVRKLLKEWNQETRWATTAFDKMQAIINKYGP